MGPGSIEAIERGPDMQAGREATQKERLGPRTAWRSVDWVGVLLARTASATKYSKALMISLFGDSVGVAALVVMEPGLGTTAWHSTHRGVAGSPTSL